MALLEATPFELIVNPEDAEPSRDWVLEKIADPEVIAACIMHGQPSDKVDKELLDKANKNLKVISTFSVGFGESRELGHQRYEECRVGQNEGARGAGWTAARTVAVRLASHASALEMVASL